MDILNEVQQDFSKVPMNEPIFEMRSIGAIAVIEVPDNEVITLLIDQKDIHEGGEAPGVICQQVFHYVVGYLLSERPLPQILVEKLKLADKHWYQEKQTVYFTKDVSCVISYLRKVDTILVEI